MIKRLTQAALLLPATLLALPAQAAAEQPGYWHHGWGGGWGWGHMIFGSLSMLLFWGAIIVAIVFAIRWLSKTSSQDNASSSDRAALDILRERFARGEIDKDEFEERKRLLSE